MLTKRFIILPLVVALLASLIGVTVTSPACAMKKQNQACESCETPTTEQRDCDTPQKSCCEDVVTHHHLEDDATVVKTLKVTVPEFTVALVPASPFDLLPHVATPSQVRLTLGRAPSPPPFLEHVVLRI